MQVGDVIAQMMLNSKLYERELSRLEGESHKKASAIGTIFKNALSVSIGMGLFEAVKQGFTATVKGTLNFNSMMEKANIGFTTMLGSASKAKTFLEDLAEFAAKTPFEFPDLLDASKRMLAYGFSAQQVLPTMEAVGNATAALGMGSEGIGRIILALGQMRAKAKVSGEEMRQLTETGIPAWEILSEAMGKSVAEVMKLSEKGLIPADKAIQDLIDGMNKRFPDMMKKMENTWEGITSTLKDVWQMTIGAMTSNLFKGLTTSLQYARDWATDFYDTFQKAGLYNALAQGFGKDFASVVQLAAGAVKLFTSTVRTAINFIRTYWQTLRIAVIVAISYAVALKTVTLAIKSASWASAAFAAVSSAITGQLWGQIPVISTVSTAVGIYRVQMALAAAQGIALSGVLARLRVALFAVWSALGPVGWAILAITGILAAGMSLWQKYNASLQSVSYGSSGNLRNLEDSFRGVADAANEQAGAAEDQADALDKAGKAAKKNLQSFDELHQLQNEDAGGGAGEGLTVPEIPMLGDVMGGLGGLEGLGDVIGGDLDAELPPLKERLKGFFEWLWGEAGTAWDKVKDTAVLAWETIKQKWDGLSPLAKTIVSVIGAFLLPAFARLAVGALISAGKVVLGWAMQAAAAVANGAIAVGALVGMIAKWAWAGVQSLIHAAKMAAAWVVALGPVAWVAAAVIALAALIIIYWDEIKAATIKIWDAIVKYFVDGWAQMMKDFEELWKDIKTIWEAIKTITMEIWDAVVTYLTGVWDGLVRDVSVIWGKIKKSVSDNWDFIKKTTSEIWDGIVSFLVTTWEDVKTKVADTWENIKTTISTKTEESRGDLKTLWDSTKTNLINVWNTLKTKAATVWDDIKRAITDPIEAAKKTILGIIRDIERAFSNMKIEIPKFKIPKISVTTAYKKVGDISIPYPDFDVDWYAKGGIFSTPSIIGVGESGTEIVAPLDRLSSLIAEALSQHTQKMGLAGAGGDVYVYIGNEQLDAYIQRSQERRNIRSNGR